VIVVAAERGTPGWREAHRRRLCASDMPALFTRRGCKTYTALVDRLVLDFEGVGLHTDEHPDPWHEQHEIDLVAGVARYGRCLGTSTITRVGFVQDDLFTWLGASPHALVDEDGCVLVRCRRTAKSWHENHAEISTPEIARAQVTMRVCGRDWCDVVDVWDPGDGLGRISRRRVPYSQRFFLEDVVPKCVLLWQAVAAARRLRHRPMV
jgi:hypothetical protein